MGGETGGACGCESVKRGLGELHEAPWPVLQAWALLAHSRSIMDIAPKSPLVVTEFIGEGPHESDAPREHEGVVPASETDPELRAPEAEGGGEAVSLLRGDIELEPSSASPPEEEPCLLPPEIHSR